jgi:hypothetical protein
MSANPFECPPIQIGDETFRPMTCDVTGRLEIVRRSDVEALRTILGMQGIQKTVRLAAERRLRALESAGRTS